MCDAHASAENVYKFGENGLGLPSSLSLRYLAKTSSLRFLTGGGGSLCLGVEGISAEPCLPLQLQRW